MRAALKNWTEKAPARIKDENSEGSVGRSRERELKTKEKADPGCRRKKKPVGHLGATFNLRRGVGSVVAYSAVRELHCWAIKAVDRAMI